MAASSLIILLLSLAGEDEYAEELEDSSDSSSFF